MKKFFLLTAASLCAGVLSGCGGGDGEPPKTYTVRYAVTHRPASVVPVIPSIPFEVTYLYRDPATGEIAEAVARLDESSFHGFNYEMQAVEGQPLRVTARKTKQSGAYLDAIIHVDGFPWKQVRNSDPMGTVTVEAICCEHGPYTNIDTSTPTAPNSP